MKTSLSNPNILISALGGSLFPFLNDILEKDYNIYYVDSNPSLNQIYPTYKFYNSPLVNSEEYKSFIKNLIKENNIEYYLPLIDEELILAKELEETLNIRTICPSVHFIELCLNKFNLMEALNKNSISNIPSFLYSNYAEDLSYPLFLKPNKGRGSRGIKSVSSPEELAAYPVYNQLPLDNILIQPHIMGDEYTVGVNVDNNNNILSICSKQIISKKGITIKCVTKHDSAIEDICIKIVNILEPKGPFNVQLIKNKQGIHIFEINPRYSTTSIVDYKAGIDLINSYIKGSSYTFLGTQGITLNRRWENIFT